MTKLGNSYSGLPRVTDENTSHYKLAVSECVGDLASTEIVNGLIQIIDEPGGRCASIKSRPKKGPLLD